MQITGDEKLARGSFTIQYGGQKFTITLSYEQGSDPTFNHEKEVYHPSPNYAVKEVSPVTLTGNQAQIVFEIDQKL